MQNITTAIELKSAIRFLELEKANKGEILKKQFTITYESFKPANILLGTLKNIATSPNIIDNVIGTVLGMASGYFTKKIVVGASAGIFRNLIGSLLQFGVTSSVSHHPDAIKLIRQFIVNQFHRKKKTDDGY